MSDEFLRKDLYEAEKDSLLILNDKTNERIDDVKENFSAQIDNLKNFVSWGFAILGAVFAIAQIALAVFMFYLSTR